MVTVDGFDFPEDLFYLGGGTDQLWIKKENGKVRLGMTSLGSSAAGKIKFIRLRPPGKEVKAGAALALSKAASGLGQSRALSRARLLKRMKTSKRILGCSMMTHSEKAGLLSSRLAIGMERSAHYRVLTDSTPGPRQRSRKRRH